MKLRDLQHDFCLALLTGDTTATAALMDCIGPVADERLEVHRNNVFASLTRALAQVFPVTSKLVHERFFAFAVHEFIRARPPAGACLAEYGADFAAFLADFEPCNHLIYLSDVAHLEWLIAGAARAPDAVPLSGSELATVPARAASELLLRLDESVGLISSPWPIDAIWRANRTSPETEDEGDLDLFSGPVRLEVRRWEGKVAFRSLPAPQYVFRRMIRQRIGLEVATEGALAIDSGFDLKSALKDLFLERLVVGIDSGRSAGEAEERR